MRSKIFNLKIGGESEKKWFYGFKARGLSVEAKNGYIELL
jgi:hypothetical protein